MTTQSFPDSKLYYECHITIEPVFDDELSQVSAIAKSHGFQVADLLMQKRKQDSPERSKHDTFMTGRSKNYGWLSSAMSSLVVELQSAGYTVWRYKIEDTILDSKFSDSLSLLSSKG